MKLLSTLSLLVLLVFIPGCRGMNDDGGDAAGKSATSIAAIPNQIRISVCQRAPGSATLLVTLENLSGKELRIREGDLPWYSMAFEVSEEEAPQTSLRQLYAIQDSPLRTVVMPSTAPLFGTIDLAPRFPDIESSLRSSKLLVSWTYQLSPVDGAPLGRLSGRVTLETKSLPDFANPLEVDLTVYVTALVLSMLVASCAYVLVRMTRNAKHRMISWIAWIVVALVVLTVPHIFVALIDAMNNTIGITRVFVRVGPIKWLPSIVGLVTASVVHLRRRRQTVEDP